MTWFIVDVEADGPFPGLNEVGYSMASFAVVKLTPSLSQTFYSGPLKPIANKVVQSAIDVHGLDYQDRLNSGTDPYKAMLDLDNWITQVSKTSYAVFVSDNPAFDWQFMNYYFHFFLGRNPFGFSARRIGDIVSGWKLTLKKVNWIKYRKTKHTHNALDDALGNAEALLQLHKEGMPCFISYD